MINILNIDTSGSPAFVAVATDGVCKAVSKSHEQKEHAAFLHIAMQEVLKEAGLTISDLAAVAVTAGPGSYTGLRVGLSSAKGIAYAANIPLIMPSVTELMAAAAAKESKAATDALFFPMIDARRAEVFTAMYDAAGNELRAPYAAILDESFESDLPSKRERWFFGSGAEKWKKASRNPLSKFIEFHDTIITMCESTFKHYLLKHFADVALSTPLYVKEFHDGA